MNKSNGEQRFDDDILQSKAEILRLKGVVPPFGHPPKRDVPPQSEKSQDRAAISEKTPSPKIKTRIEQPSGRMTDAAFSDTATFSVPRFEVTGQSEFILQPEQLEEIAIAEKENKLSKPQEANGDTHETVPEPSDDSKIPEFDLAQQIIAAQRKISGNRRKGPGSPRFTIKEEKPMSSSVPAPMTAAPRARHAVPLRNRGAQAAAPMSPQQRIIAEIVAKDIGKYYSSYRGHA